MLSIQRRDEIKVILLEKGSVTVSELVDHFNVSFQTIRRDFDVLEAEGFLSRAYGGAVLKQHVKADVDVEVLELLFLDNKQRITKKASEFIYSGDCIFLDYSTTVSQIIDFIKDRKITVMTNSIRAINKLIDCRNIKLFTTGGEYDFDNYYFAGHFADKFVSNFHLDKAFLSCRAISMENGLTDRDEKEADIHRLMIENADSVYLLMDHTKFDNVAFVHTCGFEKVTAVITDFLLSDTWKEFLTEKKIEYYECL